MPKLLFEDSLLGRSGFHMCGISGYWSPTSTNVRSLNELVVRMCDAIRYRGPDDSKVWVDPHNGFAIGHQRLSIIDLSEAGSQPMASANGRFMIAFNGEIYNHLEIRRELEEMGRSPAWRGRSDTETLIEAIAVWGLKDTLVKCVGMFAIALWDRDNGSLSLARDRLGEKPLYYGWVGEGRERAFAFASELKALKSLPAFENAIDRDALALYFQFCAIPSPYSIYKNVSKLSAGSIATIEFKNGAFLPPVISSYWSLREATRCGRESQIEDEIEAAALLEQSLSRAVQLQSIADVPLGVFLSGGVDSSMIAALMQSQARRPIQTFTVGFDEGAFDESTHARAIAGHLGVDHHELRVTPEDALAVIEKLPTLYDEPFADSSQIPTYLVCKAARGGVTVALSGDAGDELFGGYNRYIWSQRIGRLSKLMCPAVRESICSTIERFSPERWDELSALLPPRLRTRQLGVKAHKLADRLRSGEVSDQLYLSLVSAWPKGIEMVKGATSLPTQIDDRGLDAGVSDGVSRMMLWDSATYLTDDILTKVDRAAMSVSLETRAPFLDHRVVELAWRIPLHMKIRGGQGKWILRQVLYKYVPRHLIERPKSGFAAPVGQWLRGPLRDWAEALLDRRRLESEGYLNADVVRGVWREHLSGERDWTPRIWSVLMFESWLQESHLRSSD